MKIVDLIVWHANYCKVIRNITPPPDGLDISIGFYFFLGVLSLDAAAFSQLRLSFFGAEVSSLLCFSKAYFKYFLKVAIHF